ncbi:MAG: NADH:ubiquinone reductase (Na(+)-transporting) subunit A [Bacteroidetes bacterium GWF2_49_14]|nr:MAG: NADH:ubiquinone reductase (Na(+)-transporting) subunit A [Bacteroidetes bacterium GWF2_49_14]HBB90747.1 NADH:ubiquinone reductase (Na(+)-transporting) subunit A [Bacteroidales bacterium]
MSKVIKIKRGLDIRLKGSAELQLAEPGLTGLFAVKPTDFKGLEFRVLRKAGEEVKKGTPVLADKSHPEIVLVSPVAGKVAAVNRGERRKLLEVVIESSGELSYETLKKGSPADMDGTSVREQILSAGLWPAIIQRPYGTVARPDHAPRDIFISAFDSSPLAPDYEFILKGQAAEFKTGILALKKLTAGKIYVCLSPELIDSKVFTGIEGVEYTVFKGPHPAGNTGIQIHHLAPINKGEVIWTITPQFVALIGRTFLTGKPDFTWTVALAGSRVKIPQYYKTVIGAQLSPMIASNLVEAELPARIISGTVLTGAKIEPDGFIGFYDSLVTVIPEGKYFDFFGWALPGINKYSMSRAFLSSVFPKKSWDLNTNLNGGHRAFVITGQYEKVLPMDIYPMLLLKSILANDIDKMEQLGIYEVIEEDLALCEFVCTSKIDIQDILRSGLDLIRKELN